MPGFKVDKVLHGLEVQVPKATRNYETKVFVSQRFRPKKFRNEIIVFPAVNSFSSDLNDLQFYSSYAYFIKGLAKDDVILDQSYFVRGETKRKFHQTMQLQPNKEMPILGISKNSNGLPQRNITM